MKILGCWYSCNSAHEKILRSSLNSIERAVVDSKVADPTVRTCTWVEVPGNPFTGWTTFFPMRLHFGIVLQILRIFHEEQKAGNAYDAASFLEHDVLYPHDYFDRVAEAFAANPEANVVANMDYIGMNHTGWLDVKHRHEPMHQLSFRYPFAQSHFESLVEDCILHGAGMLEPKRPPKFAQIPFSGEAPSCHINHSQNFTSHFNCYRKESERSSEHPYWGDFRDYYPAVERPMNV